MSMTASAPLILAVPSKGRLQENTSAFFARAGMTLTQSRGSRDYRGVLSGVDGVEVAFLSASEIAGQLASGAVHLGVTGEDLVRESIPDADSKVLLVEGLGFGHANVVVAVPQAWIDVRTMRDLDDVATHFHASRGRRVRVATKYLNLTRAFFDRHGIVDYRIVDITTTGSTLAANALKVVDDGVMLRSEANLVASLGADWNRAARASARALLDRITAAKRAATMREVKTRFAACDSSVVREAVERFGALAPFGAPTSSGMVTLHCPPETLHALAVFLRDQGAATVSVGPLDYVFGAENPLYEKLEARLG